MVNEYDVNLNDREVVETGFTQLKPAGEDTVNYARISDSCNVECVSDCLPDPAEKQVAPGDVQFGDPEVWAGYEHGADYAGAASIGDKLTPEDVRQLDIEDAYDDWKHGVEKSNCVGSAGSDAA